MNNLDMSGILAQVTAAVGKFIDAATPIAQKAYQIGLITLQVDAAASLVPAILISLALIWFWRKVCKAIPRDQWDDHTEVFILGGFVTMFGSIYSIAMLLDVWLWVKLFSPELWLVHAAIEKVVQVTTK